MQNQWLLNVYSVNNFTLQGSLFGSQIKQHMEGAWVAKRSSRGWVEPTFVHRQRNNTLAEEMIDAGTAVRGHYPHVMDAIIVPCKRLFKCSRSQFLSYNDKYLSLEQLHTHSIGTIDHLLVESAQIIGGQACSDSRNCSVLYCPVLQCTEPVQACVSDCQRVLLFNFYKLYLFLHLLLCLFVSSFKWSYIDGLRQCVLTCTTDPAARHRGPSAHGIFRAALLCKRLVAAAKVIHTYTYTISLF